MADITLTITADEDDLRLFAQMPSVQRGGANGIVRSAAEAIAAALPKPRIVVRPGMVLRRNSDGSRWFVRFGYGKPDGGLVLAPTHIWLVSVPPRSDGLDPDEWTVILDAEGTP